MTVQNQKKTIGTWHQTGMPPEPVESALRDALLRTGRPIYVVEHPGGGLALSQEGEAALGGTPAGGGGGLPLRAFVPPLHPGDLGDPGFTSHYGLKYAYVVGEMANGITSVRMVTEAGKAGMLGFFGAGGLALPEVEEAVERLQGETAPLPFGVNLIHSPASPELETALVEMFLRRKVRLISASAYLDLTPALVCYRVKGLRRDPHGRVVCENRVVAKVSRVEVARKFLEPPPEKILRLLAAQGRISAAEAEMAAAVPVADDMTAEADSGGHTDNRQAITLLPTMIALRDEVAAKHGYPRPPLIGLGGGIATPESVAAAFALGAAYVLTGSVNQACVEAGTSEAVCVMLAEAGQADVAMAPAADMFELGVKVQVLKRGTMFPQRAARLYEFYTAYPAYEDIPPRQREILEKDFFRCSFEEEWGQTRRFFMQRDPKQVERAEQDPKHKMALVFRSYLGRSSLWAIAGEPERRIDYQIWCGPAIGAFNQWARGTFLEKPENRQVAAVGMNLVFGAAVATRANWLRAQGIQVPRHTAAIKPMPLSEIRARIEQSIGSGINS